jgi:hypothetical protein
MTRPDQQHQESRMNERLGLIGTGNLEGFAGIEVKHNA